MVYKKFKDFKLEILRMMFEDVESSEIIKRIEELEQSNSITPSQISYLVDMVYNSDRFTLTGSRQKQNDNVQILVYKKKIIASYIGKIGVYLE